MELAVRLPALRRVGEGTTATAGVKGTKHTFSGKNTRIAQTFEQAGFPAIQRRNFAE